MGSVHPKEGRMKGRWEGGKGDGREGRWERGRRGRRGCLRGVVGMSKRGCGEDVGMSKRGRGEV